MLKNEFINQLFEVAFGILNDKLIRCGVCFSLILSALISLSSIFSVCLHPEQITSPESSVEPFFHGDVDSIITLGSGLAWSLFT